MNLVDQKNRFLIYELGILTLKAALSTRDKKYPVYKNGIAHHQRSGAHDELRKLLSSIEEKYINANISEQEHIEFIENTSSTLSVRLGAYLHNGTFRIGVAQKLINLHLKYLWTSGFCAEPPHCPIDGIIRDYANIQYNWTQSNCINEYIQAVDSLKSVAKEENLTLSQWELISFRRRNDQL